jgi:hypothetical protein
MRGECCTPSNDGYAISPSADVADGDLPPATGCTIKSAVVKPDPRSKPPLTNMSAHGDHDVRQGGHYGHHLADIADNSVLVAVEEEAGFVSAGWMQPTSSAKQEGDGQAVQHDSHSKPLTASAAVTAVALDTLPSQGMTSAAAGPNAKSVALALTALRKSPHQHHVGINIRMTYSLLLISELASLHINRILLIINGLLVYVIFYENSIYLQFVVCIAAATAAYFCFIMLCTSCRT